MVLLFLSINTFLVQNAWPWIFILSLISFWNVHMHHCNTTITKNMGFIRWEELQCYPVICSRFLSQNSRSEHLIRLNIGLQGRKHHSRCQRSPPWWLPKQKSVYVYWYCPCGVRLTYEYLNFSLLVVPAFTTLSGKLARKCSEHLTSSQFSAHSCKYAENIQKLLLYTYKKVKFVIEITQN